MSNHLSIANVSAALASVVFDAVKDLVPGSKVTHVRPGGEAPGTPAAGVNVFLYGITANPSLRNDDLPTRRAGGDLAQRPRAALDLHYLLSFYGDDTTLETQRMLGSVVRTLHARPTLPRDALRDVAADNPVWLAGSDVAEAPEPVRFTPVPLTLEELSKLWSVLFQTPYALSVAYHASVVVIDAEDTPVRPALPVGGRNVYVAQLRSPTIEQVVAGEGPGAPILPDGVLVIRGRGLAGEVTRVRLGTRGEEMEPAMASGSEVRLALGTVLPGTLRAGIQGVQVIHRRPMGTPPVPHRGEESNVAPFVLRPVVRRDEADPTRYAVRVLPPAAAGAPRRVEVKVSPTVGKPQRAELLLNHVTDPDRPAFLYPDDERGADTDTLAFDAPGIEPGRYLVRVRVDGAESLLEADPLHPEDGYARPWLEVP